MERPFSVFDIAGRAMSAQLVRLNATASNLANAGSVANSRDGAFRAMRPVFRTVEAGPGVATVSVERLVQSEIEPTRRHDPNHPLADANGDVWTTSVDENAEMVEMLDSARQYQNLVEALSTAKQLMLDTMRLK